MKWVVFFKYLIFYPDYGSKGFDGIHYGSIKGIKQSAPQEAKKDFKDYCEATQGWGYSDPIEYCEVEDE